jgi:hypothetical protein
VTSNTVNEWHTPPVISIPDSKATDQTSAEQVETSIPTGRGTSRVCREQVANPASQNSTAVVEGTSKGDVLVSLKTGLRYIPKWKTEG